LRLLSDPGFGEEFDTVVDEITDEYLSHELPDEERERVQQYFLNSTERQSKLEFAAELLRRAQAERKPEEQAARPSLMEQIVAFWKRPSFALTVATLVIIAGIVYLVVWRDNSTNYLALNLAISTADRANGATPAAVKLPPNTGLKVTLTIPESARGAKDYVAKLAGGSALKTDQRSEQTITVIVPAGSLTPGNYAIQLFKVKADDTTERIPGSYFFAVE